MVPPIRYLGFFNHQNHQVEQEEGDSDSLELDESDVIWSPNVSDTHIPKSDSSSLSILSNSPKTCFRFEKFGLSAALSDENHGLVQRNSSFSSQSIARMIPPSVVVSNPRSGGSSWSEDSYSGKCHQSAPVNVPVWPNSNGSVKLGFFEEENNETNEEEEEEEMLPPHEIVARSHSTTFSVFEGVGRTLKGRDLRRVRNAVWQKTGFMD